MAGVSVTHSFVDGAHFFTSEDPKWAGLCAASAELESAWNDVGIQLNHLAKINHGMENPDFQPAATLQEFMMELAESMQAELARVGGPSAEGASHPGAMVPPAVVAWKMSHIGL